jgi:hypothetical protein
VGLPEVQQRQIAAICDFLQSRKTTPKQKKNKNKNKLYNMLTTTRKKKLTKSAASKVFVYKKRKKIA